MLSVNRVSLIMAAAFEALVLFMLGSAPAASDQPQKADERGARADIMEIVKAHVEHWKRHDMDAWTDAMSQTGNLPSVTAR